MKPRPQPLMSDAQDDLIRTVALACFSYEYETIDPDLAARAWELAVEHAEIQGLTPTEAQIQLWHTVDQEYVGDSAN